MLDLSLSHALSTFQPVVAIGLFFAYIVMDALFALYTLAVSQKRPLKAANISFIYWFVASLGIIGFVSNYLYVGSIALGSWVGTYLVVKQAKKPAPRRK
ncbi:MAG TPA: hypothetical protein VLF21_01360 [Candidatus Saccharimonadales bacterium]|nr:hypothetical protein [Candidatus Saccharimonadales bacterium]